MHACFISACNNQQLKHSANAEGSDETDISLGFEDRSSNILDESLSTKELKTFRVNSVSILHPSSNVGLAGGFAGWSQKLENLFLRKNIKVFSSGSGADIEKALLTARENKVDALIQFIATPTSSQLLSRELVPGPPPVTFLERSQLFINEDAATDFFVIEAPGKTRVERVSRGDFESAGGVKVAVGYSDAVTVMARVFNVRSGELLGNIRMTALGKPVDGSVADVFLAYDRTGVNGSVVYAQTKSGKDATATSFKEGKTHYLEIQCDGLGVKFDSLLEKVVDFVLSGSR